MQPLAQYPENFRYKEAHFEGTHTSYSWHSSKDGDIIVAKITGETKCYYTVIGPFGMKRFKKENIDFLCAENMI